MNKRINELLVEADIKFDRDINEIEVCVMLPSDLEKFAELIVQECMEVASPNYMSTPEDSVYYVEQAINRIAKHFGVEE